MDLKFFYRFIKLPATARPFLLTGLAFAFLLLTAGCGSEDYTPKPRAFPKVVYPVKAYQPFDENYCHFTFEYPRYAVVSQDTTFFNEKAKDPCWFNIYLPDFDATIHCSYYPIGKQHPLEKLREDAFELANKHQIRADYIDEFPISKPNHVSGFAFSIEGPAASPFQFYLTDSTQHFLRGSLYFNTQARPDSLAPVLDFVKKDIMQMINTFEWRN